MSKDQKGFVVYGDSAEIVNKLSDADAGRLFKGMLDYFVSGKEPNFDGLLDIAFIPIRQQMDRNTEKYNKRCEKNRENIQSYWNKVKADTNEYERIQSNTNEYDRIRMNTIATNTKTKTKTNTKTNTDTKTTTNTNTNGGGSCCDDDDFFNIRNRLTSDDVDTIYDAYPETGGDLIDTVYSEVKTKQRVVDDPVSYILGYAKNVGWSDEIGGGTA